MAYVEVPDVSPRRFMKAKTVFASIGDKIQGRYVESVDSGEYGTGYVFELDTHGEVKIDIKGQLDKRLKAAALVKGDLVFIQFTGLQDTGKENKMKVYKVGVDRGYTGALPKNGANVRFEQRTDTSAVDDIPF